MKGLHIRYEADMRSNLITERLAAYCFEGESWKQAHGKQADEGRVFLLLCNECDSNNWRDNGRNINELECDSCGQFVKTEPYQEKESERQPKI